MRRLALSLLQILAAPAAAQVTVHGDWVRLGDVAPATGEAAAVLVAPAPPPGETLALDPAFLAVVAERSGVTLALPLDEPVWVTRAAAVPAVPQAAPQAAIARTPPAAPFPAAPNARVTLARDVSRGALLAPEDVIAADGAADALIGLEAKRALRAGATLAASDLKTPAVVRKGQPVKLVYVSTGLRLTVDGQAQADAALGEPVRVLNHMTRRSIDAVASAAGEARVSPR